MAFDWLWTLIGSPPRMRIADGRMQIKARGRLPQDVAEGGLQDEPDPEYIEKAATPSEDAWAREQEKYRRKQSP